MRKDILFYSIAPLIYLSVLPSHQHGIVISEFPRSSIASFLTFVRIKTDRRTGWEDEGRGEGEGEGRGGSGERIWRIGRGEGIGEEIGGEKREGGRRGRLLGYHHVL